MVFGRNGVEDLIGDLWQFGLGASSSSWERFMHQMQEGFLEGVRKANCASCGRADDLDSIRCCYKPEKRGGQFLIHVESCATKSWRQRSHEGIRVPN